MKRAVVLLLLLAACSKRYEKTQIAEQTGGDATKGRQLVQQYGCTSCHDIPNVYGPRGMVGPPLTHIASRQIIAGHLPNTPENLASWILDPQKHKPGSNMPSNPMSAEDLAALLAYLGTLK